MIWLISNPFLLRNIFPITSAMAVYISRVRRGLSQPAMGEYGYIQEVVFEGLPGAGKTCLARAIADRLAETHTVYVNGKPRAAVADELVLSTTRGSSFIRKRYDKTVRRHHLLELMSVGVQMSSDRLNSYARMRDEHRRTGKPIVNVIERDAFSAVRVFMPAAYEHLCNNPQETHGCDEDAVVSASQARVLEEIYAELARATYERTKPGKSVVFYLRVPAAVASHRVKNRGRPYESEGLEDWYMALLEKLYERHCGRKDPEPARPLFVLDATEDRGRLLEACWENCSPVG